MTQTLKSTLELTHAELSALRIAVIGGPLENKGSAKSAFLRAVDKICEADRLAYLEQRRLFPPRRPVRR